MALNLNVFMVAIYIVQAVEMMKKRREKVLGWSDQREVVEDGRQLRENSGRAGVEEREGRGVERGETGEGRGGQVRGGGGGPSLHEGL